MIGADGGALKLLQGEFPELKSVELPAWNISYPKNGSFAWHLFFQAGKVWKAIRREHLAIEELVEKEGIDVVISDNRLGCYSKKAKSIVMSHQLFLESPIIRGFLNWNNRRLLRKFDEVWIIDLPGKKNLSGRLSHREVIPFTHRFLGLISRFTLADKTNGKDDVEVLAVISGPEPQRTLFEEELLPELEKLGKKTVVLLGKPELGSTPVIKGNLTIYPHLKSEQIAPYFTSADLVISRNGYTTVMDLAILQKRAILIPTPGQTEQEYLADYYHEKNWYVIQRQGKIDLQLALENLGQVGYPHLPEKNYLEDAVKSLFA